MAKSISDNQILDAALEVFAHEGYAGATTRQIAAAAEINEVTLFRRFGNKEKLLKAVIEQESENFKAAGIGYTGELEADLLRVVQFYQQLVQTRGHVIAMMLSEIPRQPELVELMQTPVMIAKSVTVMIERYQQEDRLISEPPINAFITLVSPLLMAGVLGSVQSFFQISLDPAEQVQSYLRGRAPISSRATLDPNSPASHHPAS